MKDSDAIRKLQEEIEKAAMYVELLKDKSTAKVLKGYVVGIQFAVNMIIKGSASSILEGADEILMRVKEQSAEGSDEQ